MNTIDALNPILNSPVPTDNVKNPDKLLQSQKEQFAKDFESVFIEKLLDEMKNTVGDWGGEQDGASQQVQGLFWMNLARDISNNGGFGLWKEIYNSLGNVQSEPVHETSLNKEI